MKKNIFLNDKHYLHKLIIDNGKIRANNWHEVGKMKFLLKNLKNKPSIMFYRQDTPFAFVVRIHRDMQLQRKILIKNLNTHATPAKKN